MNEHFWNHMDNNRHRFELPTLKINLLKKPTHKKFFATAQNTLSFFFATHNPTRKKNERVFSSTLYYASSKAMLVM
jgi:hypothetical protein